MHRTVNSMRDATLRAYRHAIINNVYTKIVEGEIDLEYTLRYFNANLYTIPCEAILKKYLELSKNGKISRSKEDEFIDQLSVYFALLDIYMNLLELIKQPRTKGKVPYLGTIPHN